MLQKPIDLAALKNMCFIGNKFKQKQVQTQIKTNRLTKIAKNI